MGLYDRLNFFDDVQIDSADIDRQLAAFKSPAPPPQPEQRSGLGEIWSQLKAGAFVDLPRMAGRAMQYTSSPGNSVYENGKSLVEATDAIEKLPEMMPGDTTGRPVVGALSKGARMIPQSIAPAAGVGLTLSGVGAPAGVALLGGSALAALPAGMAQAQETFEKGLAKHGLTAEQAATMQDDPRVQEVLNAARMTGGIEWGGETAAGAIGGKLLGIGGKLSRPLFGKFLAPVEQQAASQVLKNFSIPTMAANYGKQVFKTAAGETATEMAQSAAEAGVEQHYGYDQQTPWDAAKSAVLPSLGMTALLAPFGIPAHVAHSRGMVQAADALSNPQAPRELRSAAAEQVYSELARVSPEAASNFAARSFDAIHGQEETGSAPYGLNLDEDSIQPFTPGVFHQPEQEQDQTAAPIQPVSDGPLGKALASGGVGMQQVQEQQAEQQLQQHQPLNRLQEARLQFLQNRLDNGAELSETEIQQMEKLKIRSAGPAVTELLGGPSEGRFPVTMPQPDELSLANHWADEQISNGKTHLMNVRAYDKTGQTLVQEWKRLTGQQQQETPGSLQQQQDIVSHPLTTNPVASQKSPTMHGKPNRAVNLVHDDLVTAIGKLGGINREQAITQWGASIKDAVADLSRHASKTGKAGMLHVISSKGKPLDSMRELLEEHGYLQQHSTVEDMYARIEAATRGQHSYSNQHQAHFEQDLYNLPFDASGLNPTHDSAPMYSLKNTDNSGILTADTTGGAHHERTDEGRTAGVHQGATTVAAGKPNLEGTTLERIAGHTPDQLAEQVESTPVIGERFTRPIKQALVEHYHNPAFWSEMARQQPELAPDFKAVAATLDSPAQPLTVAAKIAANLTADAIRIKFDPTFEQQAAQHDPQAVQDLAGRWYAERGEQSPFFRLWSHNAPVISLDDAIPANSLATGKPVVVKGWHTSPGTINRYHSEFAGAHSGFETKGWIWMAPHEGAVDHLDGVDGMHGNQYAIEQFYQRMLNPKRLLMTGKAMTRAAMEKAQQQGHDGVLLIAKGKLVNSVVFDPRNFKAVENRGTFNTTEYSRYSLQEGLQDQDSTQTPPHQQNPATETASQQSGPVFSLTIDQVAKAFPNQKIEKGAEGFTVTLKNGSTIRISGTDEIQFNSKAAEASYGRTPTANEVPVAMFQRMGRDAVISLTEAGTGEIHHETFHAAMALALNEKQRATLLDKFGTEEAAAQEYQRLKDSGSFDQKKGHLWLRAIYHFFQKVRNLFSPTGQIMEQIATGKAWEQQPAPVNESPRYSLKEINNKLTQVKATMERLNKTADKSAFVKDDLKPALKTAKEGLAASWDGLKAATAPMQRSEAAEEAGRILIEGMGTRERYKEQFISNLNRAVNQTEKATSSTAKLLDLMQHSITLADKLFNTMPEAKRIDFMQRMDTGHQQANPELQRLADTIKAMFEEKAAKVQSLGTGALEQTRENYFPHIWKRGEDAKKEIISRLSKRPLEGGKGFTKGRVFDDVLAGIEAKHELVSSNPIDLVFLKLAEMDKYINAHVALQAMEASELVQLIPAAEKMPDGFTDIAGKYGIVTKKGFMTPESGTEEVSSYRYVAREDVAQVFNNYLSQGLYTNKYVGAPFRGYMQAANMLNQFQLGVGSAFHAGFTSLEAVISHGALGIKALARGDFKEAAKYLKQAPAAWYLNPKLGDTVLKAWMGDEAAAKEMPQVVEWLQMAGARRLMDSRFQTNTTQELLQKWADGNKGGAAIRALPALVEQSARPILEWLVPRQKFGVFAEMAHSWSKQNPNASHEQTRKAMQQIWNRVDSRLGQVVYDRLFVHSIAKNLTQAIIRAPGWTGGTILEVGGGIKDLTGYLKGLVTGKKPELTDRAAYTLSMLVTTAVANALLTALFTGEPPDDWKDLVAFKTGKKDEKGNPERFMLPTYMKDVYAYVQQPGSTLLHKTHPMLSLISDAIRNKDYYGTEIRHSGDNQAMQLLQVAGFTAKAFVPFWMKGVAKEQERGGSVAAMLAPLIGIMPAPASMNMTKAEKLASELVQGRMPQGTKTQEQFEKGQLIAHLTSLARRDPRQAIQEINEAVQQRKISSIQTRHIAQNARMAPVQVAFKRLSLEEAQRVWEAATPEEKRLLYPLMIRKKQNRQG